ncbi:MAG TPA: hypothetical protein DD490_16680, partial [Acidobacteria bacterium]|nr:hypothetical protein [Acidobacteriota bacterium]
MHTESNLAIAPGEIYARNLTYRAGRASARDAMPRLLPLLESGRYDLGALFSHRLPLSEGPRGYDLFNRKLEG